MKSAIEPRTGVGAVSLGEYWGATASNSKHVSGLELISTLPASHASQGFYWVGCLVAWPPPHAHRHAVAVLACCVSDLLCSFLSSIYYCLFTLVARNSGRWRARDSVASHTPTPLPGPVTEH
jgi:hypothetical protein